MSIPIAYLSRKETFSACHRLHSPKLTDEENKKIYGKCNHINGHGHNYKVEVTIRGPVDNRTGMVMNITDLKSHMDQVIMRKLDHKNLDKDVSYFKEVPSTTENLAIYIWDNMKILMQHPEQLYQIKIDETDKNSVVYRGRVHSSYRFPERRWSPNFIAGMSSDSD